MMTFSEKLKRNETGICILVILSLLCVLFDRLDAPLVILSKLAAALCLSLFSSRISTLFTAVITAGGLLPTVLAMTDDIHLATGTAMFFLTLYFLSGKKAKIISAFTCCASVLVQPLTLIFFVPSVLFILFKAKEKLIGFLTLILSSLGFITAVIFSDAPFWSDQLLSYDMSLHIFHFSTTHKEALQQYFISVIPMLFVALAAVVCLFVKGKRGTASFMLLTVPLCIIAFSFSESVQTASYILLPLLCIAALEDEVSDKFDSFFKANPLLVMSVLACCAAVPLRYAEFPYGSSLFDRLTYIIFRQQ